MKKLHIAIFVGLLTGTSFAGNDRVVVHIDKIEGTVVELPNTPAQAFDSVRLFMTFTSSPDAFKNLYSTITKSTPKPETLTEEYNEAEMDAAIEIARSRVDEFLKVLGENAADSFSVKAFRR